MAKEILIYDSIGYDWWTGGGITAKSIMRELKAIEASGEKDVLVRINSPGGEVFEGIAIYNLLAQSELNINTQIDGIAYSMGGIIALAGKKITMLKNTTLLIHNVSGGVWGNANDLRGALEMMDKLDGSLALTIAEKTGLTEAEVRAKWMDYRDHTLSAQDALEAKLIDEVIDTKKAAKADFKNATEAMAYFTTAKQKEFITNEIKAHLNTEQHQYTPTL